MHTTVSLMHRVQGEVFERGTIEVPFHPAIHGRIVCAWTTRLAAREDALGRGALAVTVDEETHLVVLRSPTSPFNAGDQITLSDLT